MDGLLSFDSSVAADKIKELKRKITNLEKDNADFKDANQVLQADHALLESLLASKDKKIADLKEEMAKEVDQFAARGAKTETAAIARF